jgi:hypothetical protein
VTTTARTTVRTTAVTAVRRGAYPRPDVSAPRSVPSRVAEPGDRRARGPEVASFPVRFPLGRLVATPGALAALERAGAYPVRYLARHATCDWGDVDAEDWAANDRALVDGERLLSGYALPNGERLLLITEADRSATSLILPEEY